MRRLLCVLLLALPGLCACQGQERALLPQQPAWDVGPLPAAARRASAVDVINGADYDAAGPGTTVAGTALLLNAAGIDYAWARYAFSVPAGEHVRNLSLDVQDVSGEYWVGLSNYAWNRWEWHGPYSVSGDVPFNDPAADYESPGGVVYWVVLAARGHELRLNSSTVDHDQLSLRPAPQDESLAASGNCASPSLIHLPPVDPVFQAGAPLIAYLNLGSGSPKLYLAYYTFGGWQQQPVLLERDFGPPALRWLGTEGVIVAYDYTSGALVDIRFDEQLQLKSLTPIMSGPGLGFAALALDVGPGGELGVAHAYADATAGQVYCSENTGLGWQNSAALHEGDPVAALCFRYDPYADEPWLFFSHGTVDTSSTIIIRFTLEEGRRTAGEWNFTPFDYPDAILTADLNFTDSGQPQLCFLAARDFSIDLPPLFSYTGTLIYDAVAAAKLGGTWGTTKVFTGSLTPDYDIPNDYVTLIMDAATEVGWAAENELAYAKISGAVDVDLNTQQPTGGTLEPAIQYMVNPGTGFVNDARLSFTSPGREFSWSPDVDGYAAAAFIKSGSIDPVALFNGQLDQPGDLMYWRLMVFFP